MRFMMIVKANKDSEAGIMPGEDLLAAMTKYNEELAKAGVLIDLSGLQPSSKGARVKFSGGKTIVTDGPFAETKELIAGYWLIQAKSRDEAIEWARRIPAPFGKGQEAEVELRQLFELDDFCPGEAINRARALEKNLEKTRPAAPAHSQSVQPYLFFDGRCEEALDFYRRTLDAQVTMLLRFKDSPEPAQCDMVPPGAENKVMHASFTIGDTTVMASDGQCSGRPSFQGFALSFTARDPADAERRFTALSEGGQVHMPLGKTFFAESFGMVADRFGVSWMIIAAL